jgi:hypothetical protein
MKPVYLAAALALLALVETANALLAPLRVASDQDWDAAAAEVRAGFRQGDLIVFAPYWADQRGRAHLGDLVSVEMAGHSDADRDARVWELSIRGEHHPEAAGKLAKKSEHGKVTLSLFEKTAETITYDFTAQTPRVTVVDRNGEQPCAQDVASGFRCPGSRVERRTLEIDYRPRRGMLIPVDNDRTTAVIFDEAELGGKLVGYTGLHDYFARKNSDGPVDLKLLVDGEIKFAYRARNADGWKRFEIATTPGKHVVRFEVSAPNSAWRNFGLHAEARK